MTASRAIVIVNWCCVAGAAVLLPWSIYPGYANISPFLFAISLPLIIAIFVAIIASWGTSTLRALPILFRRGVKLDWRLLLIAPIIIVTTYAMLKFYIPRRIAFAAHRSSFDSLLTQIPTTEQAVVFHKRVGLYQVEAAAVDPRGGTYFKTGTGVDMIDKLSFGFVKDPNHQGTPFGAADLVLRPLGNGWYWFAVSDDWY